MSRSINTNTIVVSYYFGRTRILEVEIIARRVICKKCVCGDEGSRERQNIHRGATAPILLKFGAAKHFMTKTSEVEYENPNYSSSQ